MHDYVFVTLIGNSVAVADEQHIAERQLSDLVHNYSSEIVDRSKTNGEVRESIKIRVCHVLVNQ